MGWKPYAVSAAEKLIASENIDAILTTGPPQSTHLIGLALKEKFHLPWIVDFRDPWTEVYNNHYLPLTAASKRKNKALEVSVLAACDTPIVVGEMTKNAFPSEYQDKIKVIHNGYDEPDYDRQLNYSIDKFRMRFVGSFLSAQDVPTLWRAVAELRAENADFNRDFELEIVGSAYDTVLKSIADAGVSDCTIVTGFVPHGEAIKKMQTAALLLLSIPDTPQNKHHIPAKLFEYIGSGRPIFHIAPSDSETAKIITDSRTGIVHANDDLAKMKSSLLHYYLLFKNQALDNNKTIIKQYSRKHLTQVLVSMMDRISK